MLKLLLESKYPIDLYLFSSRSHLNNLYTGYKQFQEEALAIRRIFSLVYMITKAKFSNSPNDFKIRHFG